MSTRGRQRTEGHPPRRTSKDPIRRALHRRDRSHSVMLKGQVAAQHSPLEVRGPVDMLRALGPGLVTGASDDDPSGIGTYSQAGSQTGYGLLWTVLFTYPLVTAVQEMCGRIALQTGQGLGAVLCRKAPRWVVLLLILSLVVANLFNVGADLGAVAAGVEVLSADHIPRLVLIAPLGVLITVAVTLVSYARIANILKWLTLVLFAYVVTVFIIHPDWLRVAGALVIPHLEFNSTYLTNLTAILGTTITPYLFFWQASAEIDDEREHGQIHGRLRVGVSPLHLRTARVDIFAGTLLSQVVMFAIVLTSGTILAPHGGGQIQSADQAAKALQPLAGPAASLLFSLGIIGTGLIAIPVMCGSAVYAVREFFGFGGSLGLKARYRPTFYLMMAAAMGVAIALNYLGLNPIHALVLAASLNGVVAPALLAFITAVAADARIMKKRRSGRLSLTLCIVCTVLMAAAAVAFLITTF